MHVIYIYSILLHVYTVYYCMYSMLLHVHVQYTIEKLSTQCNGKFGRFTGNIFPLGFIILEKVPVVIQFQFVDVLSSAVVHV